jgi:Leucine-rich repeat (LRR) protein
MNFAEYLHVTDVSMCDNDLLLLPEALCAMTALQRLDIRRNRLQQLPEAVGAMLSLRVLHADDNKLKALPVSFPKVCITSFTARFTTARAAC